MGLAGYLAKRSFDRFLLIVVVVTLQFILVRVVPIYVGNIDPSQFFVRSEATPEEAEQLRAEFGLDLPIFPHQYFKYVLALFTGEFGFSFVSKQPVFVEIWKRLPNTIFLLGTGLLITTIIGIVIGLSATSRRGGKLDQGLMHLSIFSFVMPTFIMGIILLMALAWYPRIAWGIQLFPFSGSRSPILEGDALVFALDYLWHLSLPLLSIAIAAFGGWAYLVRNILVSELGQDYVVTDRAKGLPKTTSIRRHVLKSVAAPLVTNRMLAIPGIFDGAIVLEVVFGWFGMGNLLFLSIQRLDYPVVQGVFFMVAVVYAITLFLADIIVAVIDPRVKLE